MSDDHDRDRDHANDNGDHAHDGGKHERSGSKPIAPAPKGGALASFAALRAALDSVNTAAVIGRTGLPMLLFKSRENNGTWIFGQKKTIPEEGSRWAVNPMTFKWGCISFNGNKVVGEHLVSISLPKPLITDMPDTGFPWQEEWAVNLKCLDGADAGVEVIFKATTDGTIKAAVVLIDEVRTRIGDVDDDGKPKCGDEFAPILLLKKDSYPHAQYGRVYIPVMEIVDWMSLDGPASTPEPAPQSPNPAGTSGAAEQPRRRRVA